MAAYHRDWKLPGKYGGFGILRSYQAFGFGGMGFVQRRSGHSFAGIAGIVGVRGRLGRGFGGRRPGRRRGWGRRRRCRRGFPGAAQAEGQGHFHQGMGAVETEHPAAAQAAGFGVPRADVAVFKDVFGRHTTHQAGDAYLGSHTGVAPVRHDSGVGGVNAGGDGLADFAAQGVEHHRIGAVPFLQGVRHSDEVGDAVDAVAGAGIGRQIQGDDGLGQGAEQAVGVGIGIRDGYDVGAGCWPRRPIRSRRRRAGRFGGRRYGGGGRRGRGHGIGSGIGNADFRRLRRGRGLGLGISSGCADFRRLRGFVLLVARFGYRVGFVGHQYPVHQVHAADFDVALIGHPQHQLFETGEAQLALVKAGDAAHQALFQGGEQEAVSSGALGADDILNGADDFGELVPSGVGQGGGRWGAAALVGAGAAADGGFGLRLGVNGIHIGVVENQAVHMVSHPAGSGPGYADHQHALAHGAQGVDDMDEVGIAGDEDEGVDVGEVVGGVNAVGGHFDINAVFDADGATGLIGAAQGQAGGDIDRLNAGGVQGRGVVDELAGALEFGGAGHPVGVSFADHHPAVVGNFLFQRGDIGRAAPGRQADFEVFPVDEQGNVLAEGGAAVGLVNNDDDTSTGPG